MRRSLPWPLLALALPLLSGCVTGGTSAPAPQPVEPAIRAPGTAPLERTAVLLAVNDVYRIEGVEAGQVGGFARLRTLRLELEREHPDLLVLHAGDMLFPSFLSRIFDGEQMIDVLNDLDGSPGFDERFFAVFGNHEFDKDKMQDASMVARRVRDSQFRWINGNVVFATGEDGRSLVASDNLTPSYLIESGGIRIGLFGLTVDSKHPKYVKAFKEPIATARELTAELRRQGAEAVVALTHLNAIEDRRLLATLGDAGPDLILGGHDHERMACDVHGRKVLKADADARTVTKVRLTLGAGGKLTVDHEAVRLDSAIAQDAAVAAKVDRWLALHAGLICGQESVTCDAEKGRITQTPDWLCLEKKVGSTRTLLEAEENKIRSRETAFGDWITDQMVAAFQSCGAQGAFINSGSLRLNQDLAAGSEIRRRHLEELFGFPTPLALLRIKGKTLREVAAHAIDDWPGAGNWLQIAGFSFVHDTAGKTISDLQLVTPQGPRPVTDDEDILVVVNRFLWDKDQGNQDYYTMLKKEMVVEDCAVNGTDLKSGIVRPLLEATPNGIAPQKDGRIRQVPESAASDPCAGPV